MAEGRLVGEDDFESPVLKEAARRLNVIGRLAYLYRAPELLRFLEALGRDLARLESQLRTSRRPPL
jgi:hypothetical protein